MRPSEQSQQNQASRSLEQETLAFVRRELRVEHVDLDMDLRIDLGVDGEDAAELLRSFSHAFGVSMGDFAYGDYFGPEAAFNPLKWLIGLLRPQQAPFKPLRIRHLVLAADRGYI